MQLPISFGQGDDMIPVKYMFRATDISVVKE